MIEPIRNYDMGNHSFAVSKGVARGLQHGNMSKQHT